MGTGKVEEDGSLYRENLAANMIRKGLSLKNIKDIAAICKQNGNGITTGAQSEEAIEAAMGALTMANRSFMEDLGPVWMRRFTGGSFGSSPLQNGQFNVTEDVRKYLAKFFDKFVDNANDDGLSAVKQADNLQNMRYMLKTLGIKKANGKDIDEADEADIAIHLSTAKVNVVGVDGKPIAGSAGLFELSKKIKPEDGSKKKRKTKPDETTE
jgi:hypothetical protein